MLTHQETDKTKKTLGHEDVLEEAHPHIISLAKFVDTFAPRRVLTRLSGKEQC